MTLTATVRTMRAADVESVVAIERAAFTTPWSAQTFGALLGRPRAEMLVLEVPEAGVVGYAIVWCVLDEGELANIAIREDHRGRGLGALLLDQVIAAARARGVRTIVLEVRQSNLRARSMYASRGFGEVGRRRDYYDDPREDALVLRSEI
ncbi:MAG: ribosomal protein S18-alanine N-acetyltransferase [Gemmatimonadetes bacterium]|nr:ribosomal protein S18-alanine N-acetyltransferase [Gemmatimonadota bacterium]